MKKIVSLLIIIIYTVCSTVLVSAVEYPKYLIKMVNDYPETKPLFQYYEEMLNDPNYAVKQIDISTDLTTDGVPFFLQWDKRWAFLNYGKETVLATSGCGPVCLSMLICYYSKGSAMNPYETAKFSNVNGYYTEKVGTVETLFTEGAGKFGLCSVQVPVSYGIALELLECDVMLVALMKAGTFTNSGHYVILRGYDDNGNFYINDPNSLIKTKKAWHKDKILPEIKKMWAVFK